MAEKKKREVAVSEQFTEDLKSVYEYGEETFGEAAAKSFVSEIYSKIWVLDETWNHHSECRHLQLKIKGWESKRGREWESKRGRENSIGTCDKPLEPCPLSPEP